MRYKRIDGFSLIEIMIVLAIAGILAAIAIPSYQESVRKGNRTDGQSALMEAASRMERYYYSNNTYTTDLQDLGYSASTAAASMEGYYALSVTAATSSCPIATCFQIQASGVNAQAEDGNLTLDSLGQKLPAAKW